MVSSNLAPLRAASTDDRELPAWSGSLTDSINQDAWINAGDAVCQIGRIDQFEAVAVLSQDDMELVRLGQPAGVYLKSCGQTIPGEVAGISRLELDEADPSLAMLLPRTTNAVGPRARSSKWYQVQIRCLEPCPPGTRIRSQGMIRIHVGSRTVGEWLATQLFRTFRWHA